MLQPRVLYLHANSEDCLAESLLHVLRLVLGVDAAAAGTEPKRKLLPDLRATLGAV